MNREIQICGNFAGGAHATCRRSGTDFQRHRSGAKCRQWSGACHNIRWHKMEALIDVIVENS
jgi:hypothetical protein